MAARAKIRLDEIGAYIVHGEDRARPMPTDQHNRSLYDSETNPYRDLIAQRGNIRICWNNQSAHSVGATVLKHHRAQTLIVIVKGLNGENPEWWFIDERSNIPSKPQ